MTYGEYKDIIKEDPDYMFIYFESLNKLENYDEVIEIYERNSSNYILNIECNEAYREALNKTNRKRK